MDLSKKRFLVVDDFSEFRSSIRGILRLLGVQHIDTAANGQDVLELCRRNSYDIILHDYNLGEGFSGQQVRTAARRKAAGANAGKSAATHQFLPRN